MNREVAWQMPTKTDESNARMQNIECLLEVHDNMMRENRIGIEAGGDGSRELLRVTQMINTMREKGRGKEKG